MSALPNTAASAANGAVKIKLPPKQRGPKPQPLEEQAPPKSKCVKRRTMSYTRETKLKVIHWLQDEKNYVHDATHVRIRVREGLEWLPGNMRPPTNEEAHQFWLYPAATISDWWRQREKITKQKKGTRTERMTKKERADLIACGGTTKRLSAKERKALALAQTSAPDVMATPLENPLQTPLDATPLHLAANLDVPLVANELNLG